MATILITGGTGLIGTALTKELLNKGYEVIVLTRFPGKYSNSSKLSYAGWDIERQTIDKDAILKSDYIIHLAGADTAKKRWTSRRKNEIFESRTKGSELIVKSLKENANNVKAVLSASAIGWYGKGTEEKPFVETDPAAEDFLGATCKAWEASIDPVASLGTRLVKFRTGVVLSNEGGALPRFRNPLRFGVATILGNGRQVLSWIHIDDVVRLYIFAMENERLSGVYNAVAPHPVSNKKFVLQFARTVRGKFFVPIFVPSFILEIVLGELSVEVLKNALVSCDKVKKEGYKFLYPSVQAALQQLKSS